jgi:SAM-dependent methyltransferase
MTTGKAGRASEEEVRAGATWLALREPADAAARALGLVDAIPPALASTGRLVVHDLGSGTGSMARWLAPQLPGPQHWVLHDRDGELLDLAAANPPVEASGRAPVTVETRRGDITRLAPAELADADLVTASALLDMLTADELDRLVATCAGPGCPVLIALSVTGRVEMAPGDPIDRAVTDAFNDHQRRTIGTRTLLGPDAVGAAATAFRRLGRDVALRPSPWRLGPAHRALTAEWFTGWLAAACEQRPEQEPVADAYRRRRLVEAAAGRLAVTVHHQDLLVCPR